MVEPVAAAAATGKRIRGPCTPPWLAWVAGPPSALVVTSRRNRVDLRAPSSDDDEAAVEEDDTVEGLREDESGDVLSDSDAEEEESAEEGGDVDVDGDEDESESGSEDEDDDDDDDDEEEEDADDEDEEETHPLFV